jgi:hypothetical protein
VAELVLAAERLKGEFQDVVILREVHRIDRGSAAVDGDAQAQKHADDAERFLKVTLAMANCEWTPQDYNWLRQRQRSVLQKTEAGRRELALFDDAPLLMDGRRTNAAGETGALAVNREELFRVAERDRVPILEVNAFHDKPENESRMNAADFDDDDFRGLHSKLLICVGARVLLTQNLWVEAGLMNGAMGVVRGFVWPPGGSPESAEEHKRAPVAVLVEFDRVELGMEPDVSESSGVPRQDVDGGLGAPSCLLSFSDCSLWCR